MLKPLDFVRPKGTVINRWNADMTPIIIEVSKDNIGIVTEVALPTDNMNWCRASIDWLDNRSEYRKGLFNAWWNEEDLEVINNLPNLLSKAMAHPFGTNKGTADIIFPINKI